MSIELTPIIFIDFKSAYDSINRRELFETMRKLEIPNYLLRLLQVALDRVECRVRNGNDLSQTVEAHTFSLDNQLKYGGMVVKLMHRPPFIPSKIPGTHP
jgi:hypothetical protein